MNDKEWTEYRRQAKTNEPYDVKTRDVLALLDERDALRKPGQLDKRSATALLREYTWLQIRMTDRISKAQRKTERKLAERILTAMSNEPITNEDVDNFIGQIG